MTPEATTALLAAIADTDPAVASRALNVVHQRHFDGQADPELLALARTGAYNRQLDRAMASALVAHREDADVRVALAAIASRAEDPRSGRAGAVNAAGYPSVPRECRVGGAAVQRDS